MKKISGETLVETMITIMVILVALMSSFKIISTAFLQKNLTSNRIIATNLAREGMEAIRYIRDYNWLYYGSNQRICWNHSQDNNDAEDGDSQNANGNPDGILDAKDAECQENGNNGFTVNQLGTGEVAPNAGKMEYALKQDGTHWYLTRAGANGHLIKNGDWDLLNKENIGVNSDGSEGMNSTSEVQSFRLCKNSSEEFFVSCLNTQAPLADANKRTPFLRFIRLEYFANPEDTSLDGILTLGQKENIIKATIGVKWFEQGIMQDVELISYLSDFYERSSSDTQN